MKKVSIVFALIAMMLFVYGCGKEDSSPKGKETPGGTEGREGDTGRDEAQPDTGGEETPDTGDGEERPDTGDGEETPDTGDGEETPDTGGDVEPAATETMKYEFEKGGMVLTIPKDWEVSIEEDAEENLLTANIRPSDGSLGLMEMNVSILATGEVTLEQFVAEVIKELGKQYPDLEPEKEELAVGAIQAIKINGEFKEDGVEYKGTVVLLVKDGFGYTVLYGIPVEEFDKCVNIHKTLYETLEITKAPQLPGADEGE